MIGRRTMLCGLAAASCGQAGAATARDTIFELRDYLLRPGKRDTLIALFERAFVESQEEVGAHVLGTFRDLDRPDHFVWLRRFSDMKARAAALAAFYGGPVWRTNRAEANATMIDTDNVHLLHGAGMALHLPASRPSPGASEPGRHLYVADIYALPKGDGQEFETRAARDANVIASFETERSPNNFPALPVHSDAVFLTLRRFEEIAKVLPMAGLQPQETLRLQPTARSLLR